jgi:hypothetical protein
VEDFVKVTQVKALFSRWSKLYWQGEQNLAEEHGITDDDCNIADEDAGAVAFNEQIQIQTTALLDDAELTEESILFNNSFIRTITLFLNWGI